jgi:hypothetical protein
MSHEVVVGRGGTCVLCGWPVQVSRLSNGTRTYIHRPAVRPATEEKAR